MSQSYIGILGLVVLLLIAYALSENRSKIDYRIIVWGLALQFGFALLIMKTSVGVSIFGWVAEVVTIGLDKANAGSEFIFGSFLMDEESVGYIFAVKALPTIIYISSLFGVLYYLGILQQIRPHHGKSHVADDGNERCRIALLRGQCVHGANGSSVDHCTLRDDHDLFRACYVDGGRHGHYRRRRYGSLHSHGSAGQIPSRRKRHECAGGYSHLQDARPGDRPLH